MNLFDCRFPVPEWGRIKKTVRIMKLTVLIFVLSCFHVSAALSQSVTLLAKNTTLQMVFKEINRQTEYQFFYKDALLDGKETVSIDVKDASIEEVLNLCFADLPITYSIVDHTITVKPKDTKVEQVRVSKTVPATIKVTGTVSDTDGKPIPGVYVMLKELVNGRKVGVATDANGNYTIEIQSASDVLIYSFVGMKKLEINVEGRSAINVIMEVASMALEEIVTTGYQKRTKLQTVGAISTIKASALETAGSVTIDKAIQGKLAGVYVRSTSGQPGEIGEIRIRGINTMTGNKEPLYVLDGMPLQSGEVTGNASRIMTTGIGNIPPEDIESLTILKDASAASIYGSRAANGVVVITTKSGAVGKDYITYTGKFGVKSPPQNKFDFMNSEQKIGFERGIYSDFHPVYGGRVVQLLNMVDNGMISKADAESQIASLSTVSTDWMKEIYRPATSNSHNLSMSGGNTKTQYYASLNYASNEGTLINNKYQTGGLNLKMSHYFKDNFLLRFNLYSTLKNNIQPQSQQDPFKYAVFANPYERPYNTDGTYAADMSYRDLTNDLMYNSALNYTNFNIIRELKENTLNSMYGNMRGQINLEYTFLKGFRFISSAAMDYTTVHNIDQANAGTYRSYYSNWIKGGVGNPLLEKYNQGFLKEDMSRTLSYTLRNSLEYTKTIDKVHFVQAFIAQDISGTRTYGFNHFNPIYLDEYRIAGFPSWGDINSSANGDMVYDKYNLLKLNTLGGSAFRESRAVSFISSLVYTYDNRYVFNGNWRMDGVDIIGSQNQFTPLWSTAVKWNAHNEEFLKKFEDVISRLVLSVGYGSRGSINRSVYPFHVYTLGTRFYDGLTEATAISYGNPVLKWEKKTETTLGLELSLFKGRINFEGQYFNEHVNDLLDQAALPASIGRTSTTVNVGSLSNKGFELSTRIEALKGKNFLVEFGGNISVVKNNLDQVYNNIMPNLAKNSTSNVLGYPTNSWFGYKFSNINDKNGHMMVWALRESSSLENGVVVKKYTDELIDIESKTYAILQANYRTYYLGHQDPYLFGGFNARVVYKDFELNAQFVYAGGNKILDFQDRLNGPSVVYNPTDDVTASRTNRLLENLNRWRQPGDLTDIPKFNNSISGYSRYLIDKDLSDGSYLKCTQLALSWRVPAGKMKGSLLNNMRVTIMGDNLFTVTNYRGSDPETQIPFGYPNTSMYTISMTLGF